MIVLDFVYLDKPIVCMTFLLETGVKGISGLIMMSN